MRSLHVQDIRMLQAGQEACQRVALTILICVPQPASQAVSCAAGGDADGVPGAVYSDLSALCAAHKHCHCDAAT